MTKLDFVFEDKNSHAVYLRIPEELYKQLNFIAKSEGTTFSDVFRATSRIGIKAYFKQKNVSLEGGEI